MVATDKHLRPREAPFNLSAYLQERQAQVETALDGAIPVTYQTRFMRRCALSVSRGKRLRPILCLLVK